MEKKKKIFYLITGIVVAAVIIYFVFFFKSQKGGIPKGAQKPNVPKPVTNARTNPDGSPLSDAQVAGVDTSVAPVSVADASIAIGSYVYAGQDLQTYKSCNPSPSNLYKSFKAGDYIGVYIKTVGNCIQTAVDTWYTFLWLDGYNSVPTGSDDVFIPSTGSVYYTSAPSYVQVAPIDSNGCDANCNDPIGVSCRDTVGCPQ